jgi:hypothetical protein
MTDIRKKLEVLLNMFSLQAAISVPTRIHKKTKAALNQIILNPELWGFKTEVLEISVRPLWTKASNGS